MCRKNAISDVHPQVTEIIRVSVQGVKSLGGQIACLCWGFDIYEVKKLLLFKKKWKYFYTFHHFYSKKSSKRAK